LRREHCAGKSTGDYDNELRKQSNLDDLIKKQLPAELARENRTKRVSREQNELAQILEKRKQRCAQSVKESNHYSLPSVISIS
jgi:hypothetical protein